MKKENLIKINATIDSKEKVAQAADQLAQAVLDGHIDPKEAAVALDAMGKVIKAAIDKIDDLVLTELGKYHKGERILVGRIELQPKEAAPKYDYAGTGDLVWQSLAAKKAEAEKALKERETFLKALSSPVTVVDEETGEVTRITPPGKSSTSTYAIIYPKG